MLGHVLASGAPLPGLLRPVAALLDHYGYLAIALLVLAENIGVPVVPGEIALIAGAVFAGTGRAGLDVVAVGVIAAACCLAGAQIGYLIGRLGGRALVLRYGRYVFIREHHLQRAEAAAVRYGTVLVVAARFVVGLREFNGIIAGVTGMSARRFLACNAAGAAAWTGVWVSVGYLAGDHIGTVYAAATRYSAVAAGAVVVLAAALVAWRVRVRRARRAAAPPDPPGAARKERGPVSRPARPARPWRG